MKEEAHEFREELAGYKTWVPPEHFYSPFPDLESVRKRAKRIFELDSIEIPGVDLRLDEQLRLGDYLLTHYRDDYFPEQAAEGCRYYWRKDYFPFGDAFYTDRYLRDMGPGRVIEVGSGYSSAVMLDVCTELHARGTAYELAKTKRRTPASCAASYTFAVATTFVGRSRSQPISGVCRRSASRWITASTPSNRGDMASRSVRSATTVPSRSNGRISMPVTSCLTLSASAMTLPIVPPIPVISIFNFTYSIPLTSSRSGVDLR